MGILHNLAGRLPVGVLPVGVSVPRWVHYNSPRLSPARRPVSMPAQEKNLPRLPPRASTYLAALAVLLLGLCLPTVLPATPPRPSYLDRAMRHEASLRDVFFVDAEHGWAVGDRGAIWHTRDGGRRWEPQESRVACRLNSVEFVDRDVGWAAGGWTDPISYVSRGVLLTTSDGGRTWNEVATPQVAEFLDLGMRDLRRGGMRDLRRGGMRDLRRGGMRDLRRGWAVTRGSSLFPGGGVTTEDGGRGWTSLETTIPGPWHAGDLRNAAAGILAGGQGRMAFVRGRTTKAARTNLGGLRRVTALRLIDDHRGIAIGDGGLVVQTPDAGGSWQPIGSLPAEEAALFDWQGLTVRGDQVWIAGSPGSWILHSPDGGSTWRWQPTGQTLPLAAVHFVDERHGWAVGALGNIVATKNGGQSWQPQRTPAARLAWLGVVPDAETAPLELIARLSPGEGYYGGLVSVARRDFDTPSMANATSQRACEAAVLAGTGETVQLWQFPVRQRQLQMSSDAIAEVWDDMHAGQGLATLEEQLVRQLRTWRPTVLILPQIDGDSEGTAALVRQAVLSAAQKAADARQYPTQVQQLRLPTWQVAKIFAVSPAARTGSAGIETAQFVRPLGKSLFGFTARARGLLDGPFREAPTALRFDPLLRDGRTVATRDDLFAGHALTPGGEARRRPIPPPAIPLVNLRRLADRRGALAELLAQAEHDRQASTAWQKKVIKTLRDLDRDTAAEMLSQLATGYERAGHWQLANESRAMIAELFPGEPLADAARLQLIQHDAATERPRNARAGANASSTEPAAYEAEPTPQPRGRERAVAFFETNRQGGPERAIEWATELRNVDEGLFADPRIQLPVAAAHRRLGQLREAQRALLGLARTRPHDRWQAIAQRELTLLSSAEDARRDAAAPNATAPNPTAEREADGPSGDDAQHTTWKCLHTENKPYLDGVLEEACWQRGAKRATGAARLRLTSRFGDDAAWPAEVLLAYDDEYLYLATRATKGPGARYEAAGPTRQRDVDLSRQDRISFFFDVDRDYATYYELTVDARGDLAEQVGLDRGWNPEWFVAHKSDERGWTCEAAIAWSSLVRERPASGTVWAIGIQRIVPGVGFQSAGEVASPSVLPEGFELLEFK
ncbi:MAG: hypothetical protein DWQ31_05330 [Planctomycetota bacterium]|nr:MAG: hypothetical protein DWQ31_05330 [Planctomycetota bacterium]